MALNITNAQRAEVLTQALPYIQKYYKKAAFQVCQNAEFALATLGNDAGMYGCVQMILQ